MRCLTTIACTIAAAAVLAAPATLAGQVLVGQVVDHEDDRPLNGVQITLLDTGARPISTHSDANGHFRLIAPAAGVWRIRAEYLGYETVVSDSITLPPAEVVTVQVRMPIDPVQLEEGIVARADRAYPNATIAAFHRRRQQGERSGFGRFLHGEDLENRGNRVTSLLQTVPGVRLGYTRGHGDPVIQMQGGCIPAVFVDGVQINRFDQTESLDSYVDVSSLEGIEIYSGAQQPGMYYDRSGCGSVLVWTDPEVHRQFSWFRFAIGIALIAALLTLP